MASGSPSIDDDDDYSYEVSDVEASGKKQKKQRKSVAGRKLMRWNPDIDQLTLLCVEHVCIKRNLPIPWDEIAKEVGENLSGEAIKQHLAKVRKYREEFGHKVPGKLDKGARRKSTLAANSATPAKGGRSKKVKEESEDDTPQKGRSLLWMPPPKKKKPKKEAAGGETATPKTTTTPKTPAKGRGRAKKVKGDGEDDEVFDAARLTKSTGKRTRVTKKQQIKDEEADSDDESPTKKPKLALELRPTFHVNYKEQVESDSDEDVFNAKQPGDDDDASYEVDDQSAGTKGDINSSRNSEIFSFEPLKAQAVATIGNAHTQQVSSYQTTPDNTYSDGTSDYHGAHSYGLSEQAILASYNLPPAMNTTIFDPSKHRGQGLAFGGFGNSGGMSHMGDVDHMGDIGHMGNVDNMGHVSHGHGMPNFPSAQYGQYPQQHNMPGNDFDFDINSSHAGGVEPRQIKQTPRPKADRKNSTPKDKKSATKQSSGQQGSNAGNRGGVQKVESEQPPVYGARNPYTTRESGDNMIMNDGRGASYQANNHINFGQTSHGIPMNLNTNLTSPYPVQYTTSPTDIAPASTANMGGGLHTEVDPNFFDQFLHDNSLPQLTQASSLNSSFVNGSGAGSSFHLPQNTAAPPEVEFSDPLDSVMRKYDETEYQQGHPGDEDIDDMFFNYQGYDGFAE